MLMDHIERLRNFFKLTKLNIILTIPDFALWNENE